MLNRIIVSGFVTKNIELKQTTSGVPVCSFSVAVRRNYRNRDGEYETDFLDVVAYKNTASFISQYFTKGSAIIVEGALETRTYTDRNGVNHRVCEIVAEQAHFCGRNGTEEKPQEQTAEQTQGDEDLPF